MAGGRIGSQMMRVGELSCVSLAAPHLGSSIELALAVKVAGELTPRIGEWESLLFDQLR